MDEGPERKCSVTAVLFDFGGVLAEEGFVNGLEAIARRYGLDRDRFVALGHELVHETGYVTGRCKEGEYWEAVRRSSGIDGDDRTLRHEILSRFVPRPWMFEWVDRLRGSGLIVGILSDQTDWLDELDARFGLFVHFDHVFNSFHMGKNKKDPSHFIDVTTRLGLKPEQALFVDDREENCATAASVGLKILWYRNRGSFEKELLFYCPGLGSCEKSGDRR
jgi:putative hydrolase of the HAD superfamily